MRIDVNIVAADDATKAALAAIDPRFINFTAPGLEFVPLQGDLMGFGPEDESTIFMVVNRLFIWRSPEHLVLQPLLQLAPPPAEQ
jgi:hypothetical protein